MENPARDEETGLPGGSGGGPARQRSSIPSFLFISFMLFMLTSHNGDEYLARRQYQEALQSLTYQLGNFTAWMNGTSSEFSVPDRDPRFGALLDDFNIQGSILNPQEASYHSNVTGFIHATAHYHNITPTALLENVTAPWNTHAQIYMDSVNETAIVEALGNWNWTGTNKMALSVVEKLPTHVNGTTLSNTISLVHGRIELTDAITNEDLRLEFEGVHFILNGSIYGLAEPPGHHIDIRLLPSLVPTSAKNETARLIEPELTSRIHKLKNLIDAGIIDSDNSNDDPPKSTCPFTFHAQLHPINVPEYLMQELEEEIQKPTGVWTIGTPKLVANGLLVSKECGLMFEMNETQGLRSRAFFRKVTTYASLSGLAYLVLLVVFSRQTERSRTPSGLARVSRWLFLSQSTIDSVSFAGHITFAILAEGRPSISLIAPAFLACVLFVYEAQFSVLIHQIQLPEDTVTPPTPPPPASETPAAPMAAQDDAQQRPLPLASNDRAPRLPTPTPTPPTPISNDTPTNPASRSFISFFFHHVRADPQARLWVILFVFLTFIVRVILSPTLSMVFVAVTYSFIWLPQIIRSVRRGRTSGLSKEYIVGTTVCRLYLALYFLACPKNVLDIEPRRWVYVLSAFVCLQAIFVMLQDWLGPAFFLPKRFLQVKTYDYHPPLPMADPEAPGQSLGDCAICMDAIVAESRGRSSASEKEWDAGGEGGSKKSSAGLLSGLQMGIEGAGVRRIYSLAPCSHLFHTECLEKWLAIKNICPQCRRPLPPL